MACVICTHPRRQEIEDHLLAFDMRGEAGTLDEVAKRFGVPVVELQVHALMHTPMVRETENGSTIAGEIKKGEANILAAVAEEYYVTLRKAGKEIRARLVPSVDQELGTLAMGSKLSKELVELYLGTGTNIRQTIGAIVEMNQTLSSEGDPALNALKSLVDAVRPPKHVIEEEDD